MLSSDRLSELNDLLIGFDSGYNYNYQMDPGQHQFPEAQQQQQQLQPISAAVTFSVDAGDRLPQWSVAETRALLSIRSELDRTFLETKRNKVLWEVVVTKMREKGFNRSAEQCKCKWKNLVTRYKGCESSEPEVVRQQFPFYDELQSIFAARIQRMLWTEVSGLNNQKSVMSSSSEEEEEEEGLRRKKKARHMMSVTGGGDSSSNLNEQVKEMLDGFMRQQMQLEVQWREAVEVRESERRKREVEWRQAIEAMERERVEIERWWREREEERRSREEERAERRDALITALLNKLNRDDRV